MANEENLKPFKKGKDDRRNLKGRPKGSLNRATIVKEILEQVLNSENPLTEQMEEMPNYKRMVYAMVKKANNGDVSAFKELMDSAYGKTADIIHTTNYDGMSEEELKKLIEDTDNELE